MINSLQGINTSQNGNIISNSKTYIPEFKLRPDVVSINKPMSEYMTKKQVGIINPSFIFGGVLNGNSAQFVVNSEKLEFGAKNVKGNINGQNIELRYQNKTYQGIYGDNEFKLTLQKADLLGGTRYITGTINGNEVEFDLKNSTLPKESDTQNILASVLLLNGESANVKSEEFIGTKKANWVIQDDKDAAMMAMMAPPGCGI